MELWCLGTETGVTSQGVQEIREWREREGEGGRERERERVREKERE